MCLARSGEHVPQADVCLPLMQHGPPSPRERDRGGMTPSPMTNHSKKVQTPTPNRGPVWAGTVPLETDSRREAKPGASAGLSNLKHGLHL